MSIKSEEYVLYRGRKYQVEFYYTKSAKMPAKEFFDCAEYRIQLKLLALVKYIAEHGKLYDISKFRQVDKKYQIYEFKPLNERYFSFFYKGKRIILTNAYQKRTQKLN